MYMLLIFLTVFVFGHNMPNPIALRFLSAKGQVIFFSTYTSVLLTNVKF